MNTVRGKIIDILRFKWLPWILAQTGFGAIETSGGMWENVMRSKEDLGWPPYMLPESRTGIRGEDQEAYFLSGATAVKKRIQVPVILVGGLRSRHKVHAVLASGAADFISLSRPLIRQPDLPSLWQSGRGPDRADCISCNACLVVGDIATVCRQKKS